MGKTGSGKTSLAERLCNFRTFVVVFDWKGLIRWRGYQRYTEFRRIIEAHPTKYPKLIYAPNADEIDDPDLTDSFFKWVYHRGNCVLYVDEAFSVTNGRYLPRGYNACLTRGRERNISVYSSSQRPKDIPTVLMSEAEHWYSFYLKTPADVKKVGEITGASDEQIESLQQYQFLYATDYTGVRGPFRLNLGEKK